MRRSNMARRPGHNDIKTKGFQLKGGLNEITPPLSLRPGELYACSNYECAETNGYRRIGGYERLDGQHPPSESNYWLVNFDAGSTAIMDGDNVSIVASPTSSDLVGEVLADAVLTSGAWDGTGAGYLYVTRVTNRVDPGFSDNDTLYVSGSSVAAADGSASKDGAESDADNTTYIQSAIGTLRARILVVPGSGKIRGVWLFNGKRYAFRDNALASACIMYESSATGWVAVDLGATIAFTGGTDAGDVGYTAGETVSGGVSLATAIVVDTVKSSGDWSAGTAAGTLYVKTVTGTFQVETITGGTSGTTSTGAAESAVTLLPGGRYDFVNENFYGATSLRGMYGVDGINPGFMLTARGFRQIPTGMVNDTPQHVIEHKKHLFYSFEGGSVQHSPTGDPGEVWTPILGAAEIGTGDEVSGFMSLPGGVLGILNRNSSYVLSGTGAGAWVLNQHSDEAGGIEWSNQRIGKPIYFDDRGLMEFTQTQDFGDFRDASFSEKIRKTLNANKAKVISSTRVKDKNQYRLFFNNKTFIICTFEDKKVSGFTTCEYPITVECTASTEDSDGTEVLLFGSTDGYVYQADKGTSFDGASVDAFIRLAFNFINQAEFNKEYIKAVFEVDSPEAVSINFTPDYSYGESDDITQALAIAAAGGVWDVSLWGEFVWGDQLISNPIAYLDGIGQNIGITLYSSHTYEAVHTFNSVIIHYINRGRVR